MPNQPYRIAVGRNNLGERWNRQATVRHVEALESNVANDGTSERAFCECHGVARSTLRQWVARKHRAAGEHSVEAVAFFESSEGLACLHRIVVAAQFATTQLGSSGIRVLCEFLELSGLDAFVASSFGSQQSCIAAMEQTLVRFGTEERERLSESMPRREISV